MTVWVCCGWWSGWFDFAGAPGLVEERLERVVQPQDGEAVAELDRRDGVERHAGAFDEAGGGTAAGAPKGAAPARNVATAVPGPPGTYREMRNPLRIASTGTRGSLSAMNARPSTHTRVVRAWET